MNTEELKRVLDETPDKLEWKETTSLKFKQELIDFFGKDFKDKDVLEVGCHVGHTSRILSYLFKKVYAMNVNGPLFGDRTLWEINDLVSENDVYKQYSVNIKTTFDKKFENPDEWLMWARTFPYQITEIGVNNGKEKVIISNKINSPVF